MIDHCSEKNYLRNNTNFANVFCSQSHSPGLSTLLNLGERIEKEKATNRGTSSQRTQGQSQSQTSQSQTQGTLEGFVRKRANFESDADDGCDTDSEQPKKKPKVPKASNSQSQTSSEVQGSKKGRKVKKAPHSQDATKLKKARKEEKEEHVPSPSIPKESQTQSKVESQAEARAEPEGAPRLVPQCGCGAFFCRRPESEWFCDRKGCQWHEDQKVGQDAAAGERSWFCKDCDFDYCDECLPESVRWGQPQ
ncbi:hypothetical protein DIPPA_59571 [Diplonema papillatum]|nr:hypothetical protein DIPPA_54718 [Diplonema papillatum]KAJ9462820.1 hypothetical protein DIPPA_59571 [Diplonema papillatum]